MRELVDQQMPAIIITNHSILNRKQNTYISNSVLIMAAVVTLTVPSNDQDKTAGEEEEEPRR